MLTWARRRPLLSRRRRGSSRSFLAIAAVAGLFLFVLLFLEFPGVVLMRQMPFVSEMLAGSDLWQFNYPVRRILTEGLRQGHIPLWTDAINTGFPIHAEGQGGFLYPPNLLLGLLPLPASANLSLLLTYLSAGIFLCLYAREIGQSRAGALFAGMVFAFSGFMFGHLRHSNLIASAQWLPLALLLCERYARTRRPVYLLALAPVQALQHLAGHPQITFYSILFTGVYLLVRVPWKSGRVGEWGSGRRGDAETRRRGDAAADTNDAGEAAAPAPAHPLSPSPPHPFTPSPTPPLSHSPTLRAMLLAVAMLAGATVLGAGLAGAQLLPTWELAQLTYRPAKGGIREATFHTLPLPHLATFVWPFAFGDPGRDSYSFFWPPASDGPQDAVTFWENSGYVGNVALILALYAALALWRRNRWAALFAVAAVVSLLLAMGKQTPLFPLLWRYFPGMAAFRVPGRFLLITDLSLAVLAGFGLQAVRARLAAERPRWATPIVAGLVVIAAAELLYYDSRQYALVDARKWLAPPPVAQAIGAGGESFRVTTWQKAEAWLEVIDHYGGWHRDPDVMLPLANLVLPNGNVLQGLSHFGYYSGFTFVEKGKLERTINQLLKAGPDAQRVALRILGLYNVGYLTVPDNTVPAGGLPASVFPVPGRELPIRLYRNPSALPRAYLAASAVAVRDPQEGLLRLADSRHDPRQVVVIDGESGGVGEWGSGRRGDGETRRRGDAETRRRGDAAMGRRGDGEMGRRGDAAMGRRGDAAMARRQDGETRRRGDGETGRRGDAATGRGQDGETRRRGDGETRRRGDAATGRGLAPAESVVSWVSRDAGRPVLDVEAPADAWLVLSDFYYPGWRASVDGRPARIHRANLIARAVQVPAGRHRVTFSYEPAPWTRGLAIGGLSLLLLAAALMACRRAEHKA